MGMITYSFLGYDDKKNNMGIDYGQKEQCFFKNKKIKNRDTIILLVINK